MNKFAIIVLSGGYSERFGGKKAFYRVDEKPLIQFVIDRISSLSGEIVISCRSDVERLEELFPEAEVVKDKLDVRAPLVGLISSLPSINSTYSAIVTCDSPKINPEVLNLLHEEAKGHSAAVPKWPNGYLEPLTAIYRTNELKKYAKRTWENGEIKISRIVDRLPDVVFVPTEKIKKLDPDLDTFINLNTPEKVESELGRDFQ